MKLNRRRFFQKFILGVMGFVVIDSYWLERYFISWTEFDLAEGEAEKIKAIQLSDLHLKEIKYYHKSIANRINEERPDVLFITGDTIEHRRDVPIIKEFLDLIAKKIPKIAILGNKEYSGKIDLDTLKTTYSEQNGQLLINKSRLLKAKGREINIVGIDDYVGGVPDFTKACQTIDKSRPIIILNHCPAYRETIDIQAKAMKMPPLTILSGHTHGGQITFFGKPLFMPRGAGGYIKGWYTNNTSKMYVSKGVGTAILPLRFGARAEASIFYL
ncbi:metallophosphoesterase [Arenibacter sp. 6A1]|uniref:metallophosphoesterase n=1 Tax=Arenibacter sp. 6A1 TaxID=2720391 RepID=UPI001448492D|nr:metallophosphoesterase [Arenibacter sp. 6A1]NKI27278.1 metallophosphoesterase [Arenibacter sp. 6A1]